MGPPFAVDAKWRVAAATLEVIASLGVAFISFAFLWTGNFVLLN